MTRRDALLALAAAGGAAVRLAGQSGQGTGPGFICPMDKDVKSFAAGKCPRCGMKLVANLPEAMEYRLAVRTVPRTLAVGRPGLIEFRVTHPKTGAAVREFDTIHERPFHAFLISADLADFAHEHPAQRADGSFVLPVRLARSAPYRVAADFYPHGGTPQFLTRTIFPAGAPLIGPPRLAPDYREAKPAQNLRIELTTEPAEPIAGQETLLFFRVTPHEGLEPYLGAWGHLLAASDDLVDVVHDHPLYVDGVPPPDLQAVSPKQIQFNLIFPRVRAYRVWVQFARSGIVNTAAFTIPVKPLA